MIDRLEYCIAQLFIQGLRRHFGLPVADHIEQVRGLDSFVGQVQRCGMRMIDVVPSPCVPYFVPMSASNFNIAPPQLPRHHQPHELPSALLIHTRPSVFGFSSKAGQGRPNS